MSKQTLSEHERGVAPTAASKPKSATHTRTRTRSAYWFVGPGLLFLSIAFILPLVMVAWQSFQVPNPETGIRDILGLENYQKAATDTYYWMAAWRSLELGVTVAAGALLLTYPLAYFLARTKSKWKGLLIVIAVTPLLVSSVVRTYGWIVILGNDGLVNQALRGLGLIESPIQLMNNMTGVNIALIEIMMPFMLLVLLSGFGSVDISLEEAAQTLGASRLKVFLKVIIPLTIPAVITGFLFVFVLTISALITPVIMGGGRVSLLATEIYYEATSTSNWAFAGTLSVILLILFSAVLFGYQRAIRAIERKG